MHNIFEIFTYENSYVTAIKITFYTVCKIHRKWVTKKTYKLSKNHDRPVAIN